MTVYTHEMCSHHVQLCWDEGGEGLDCWKPEIFVQGNEGSATEYGVKNLYHAVKAKKVWSRKGVR